MVFNDINNVWIFFYYDVACEYDKYKYLDRDNKVKRELREIFYLGGIEPLFTTLYKLDELKIKIENLKILNCRL